MAEDLKSLPVPNLVQGVSQQAAQNRRETQCEAQYDCINSPVLGCDARPGIDFSSLLVDADYTNSFFYEIKRGTTEHYLVVVTKTESGGELEVFDFNTGDPCSVTFETGSEAYLATVANPKDVFKAVTVEDYTFIVNRETIPTIDASNKSPAKRNEAIVYWKASAYYITFQLAITYNNKVYQWTYQTPDNSTPGNAEFITTNAVAATFYRTLTGLAAVPTTTGATATSTNQGVGAVNAGQTTGASGSTTALSLGFTVRLNGNCILISRSDSADFSVDTADGVGDTYMKSVKDYAQAFSDLPGNCFEGFTCKVRGTNREAADDYFVQFQGGDGGQGTWIETCAPGLELGFDPDTMPHALVNTDVGEFTFQIAPWQFRVSGDGDNTSKDPSFVDRAIWDLVYDNNRLAILVEGATSWSKLNDPFTYFPSSAQTTLATDPIDIKVGGGRQIVLLRKAVQMGESTFLWAQKAQFRVSSGQQQFAQDTVESKRSTSYEFAETPDPLAVADSLYFATEPGRYATIRDLTISQGTAQGVQDVTAHVKKYIRSGVRHMTASDTLGILVLTTDAEPNVLYIYNFLLGNNENGALSRLQSAWNKWRLPVNGTILWATIEQQRMDLVIQRPEGVILGRIDLSPGLTDDGFEDYLTRVDLRMTEDNISTSYDAINDVTTITLPFNLTEASGDEARAVKARKAFVVTRETGAQPRGYSWQITYALNETLKVKGNASAEKLYIGLRIRAERQESKFYIRTPNGIIPTERLQVVNFLCTHTESGYYRIEVETYGRLTTSIEWTGRVVGDALNVIGSHPITDGQLKAPVNSDALRTKITLINDSFLPSRWQTAEYHYRAKVITPPQAPSKGR